ncbi:hypothetical protein G7Y79_00013g035250 [Physcia stellaris]|nr:hypothetical protein G7Y79_00013g035250 [Physcia stellaris]
MNFLTVFWFSILAYSSAIFAEEFTKEPEVLGTDVGDALLPRATPAPERPPPNAAIPGPLTISITNSFGSGLSISYGHDAGSPTALNNPTPGPLEQNTQILYPSGWAGRINIGKDFNPWGSKIEASFSPPTYQPHVDVSYVDGYTVPLTCSCAGTVITGCNIPLFSTGQVCTDPAPGPTCYNPLRRSDQRSGTPAAPFFRPCQGAAYTYPYDDTADSGCDSKLISCCVGSACPAPARQRGKRALRGRRGGGWAADAV